MPPLLIAAVPPPPEAGGWDTVARFLLGVTGWPVPRWLRPTLATPAEVLSAYADSLCLWPEYEKRRPAPEARERAAAVSASGRVVVLLGREAQRAFQEWTGVMDFFEWASSPDGMLYGLIPYPSAWNRLWNYRENRAIGRRMLQRALDMDCQGVSA